MKRLFIAMLAAAFTFAFAAPVHQASAAPVGDPGAGKPETALDSSMNDKDKSDADKGMKGKKHHHKHKGNHHAKTTEESKTIGGSGPKHHHDHDKDMNKDKGDNGDAGK